MWDIRLIRNLIPKTLYEREAFLKSFLLFFLTIEILLGVIFFLVYRIEITDLRERIFLEMKNYSYTFKGEKFGIDVVPSRVYGNRFYELMETAEGLSIMIPVPGSKEDALLIYYPWHRFEIDRNTIAFKAFLMFFSSSLFSLLISLAFALYSINPLRKALQMIEEVTRDIVHDINTPLMTLKVNLKLLRKKYGDEELERVELALRQLENLKENLSPLLERRRLKIEELDLKKLVETELLSLSRLYPEIRVDSELEKVIVRGDGEAVERIVGNILTNAFKHNTGDWVRVKLTKGSLIVENPSKEIENLGMLFERYYRESPRGMGLGLSIVKRLCEELGWKVSAGFSEGVFQLEVFFR